MATKTNAVSNANALTFGIEIECYIPRAVASLISIGSYRHGVQIECLPVGWIAKHDGSIQPPAGKVSIEVVSPVLVGADGLAQVVLVLDWLKSIRAKCNNSCGIHIHVGAGKKVAWKVLAVTAAHEKALFAASGAQGKIRSRNHFCAAISMSSDIKADYNASKSTPSETGTATSNRYQSLNLQNIWRGVRDAVEFRTFAATFKVAAILGYIRLCLGIVDYAASAKLAFAFELKSTPTNTSTGEQVTKSLLSKLRWGTANWGWIDGGNIKAKAAKNNLIKAAKLFDLAV